jgi:hypothetical protein
MVEKSFDIPAILFYLASNANKNKWEEDLNTVSQISIYACSESAILQAVCPFLFAKDPHVLNPQK